MCAPPGRVAQPRLLAADRGYPAGAVNRGRLFFGYFILAKQKKVACCRATPGGFDFGICVHHRVPAASRRPFDRLRANGSKCRATSCEVVFGSTAEYNDACYEAFFTRII